MNKVFDKRIRVNLTPWDQIKVGQCFYGRNDRLYMRIETIGDQSYRSFNCVDLVSGNGAWTDGQGSGFEVVTVDLHVVK